MRLNLDLLAEEFQGAESARDKRVLQKLERVRKESHRLEGLLEDFLRFVRVERLSTRPVDLNAVVEDVMDFCEPQALAQNIVTRAQLADGLPRTWLDVDLFKQALLNLIQNAQHAMPEGGELIFRTHHDGDAVALDLIDTGVGMPPEVQDRVFEAFFSTRPRGTGLGLATVRRIIEAHGGTITLRSEPGKGTQFTIRLPSGSSPGST
jgi:signal transduction histidine kinase